MNLYLKYRPGELSDVVGNDELISTLDRMLENPNKVPHSFLLNGPTGCGKTTIARIIAKRLGCTGFDLREIDNANFRGIDTIREIIKQTQFKPLEGPCQVWIIDECHKMTNDAQNALLKILEDTPKHVYFILCTTDPQKLLATIKGRCSTFTVKTLSEQAMLVLLRRIARLEGEKLQKQVYEQIIQDSLGHARNAIQTLQQVIDADPDNRLEVAKKAAEEQSQSIELCRALLGNKSWKEVSSILNGLKSEEPESIRRHVLGYAQAVLLKTDNPQAGLVLEEFLEPFYNTGFPGLVYACYSIIKN